MPISARNQLKGTVKSVQVGGVMAEIVLELPSGQEIVSVITRDSVETLNIKNGDTVTALIKSSDVMIQTN